MIKPVPAAAPDDTAHLIILSCLTETVHLLCAFLYFAQTILALES
jgi:hypothetical protein